MKLTRKAKARIKKLRSQSSRTTSLLTRVAYIGLGVITAAMVSLETAKREHVRLYAVAAITGIESFNVGCNVASSFKQQAACIEAAKEYSSVVDDLVKEANIYVRKNGDPRKK